MSLVEKNPSPSPTRRKSDDEKRSTNDGSTKPDEAKGGLSHYFVSFSKGVNEEFR
jgi:hypothetical protein